jgi:hypothetical protein
VSTTTAVDGPIHGSIGYVVLSSHLDRCVYVIRQNMSSKVTVETLPIMPGGSGSNDIWKYFSFMYDHLVAFFSQTDIFCYSRIVRTLSRHEHAEPTFKLVVTREERVYTQGLQGRHPILARCLLEQ